MKKMLLKIMLSFCLILMCVACTDSFEDDNPPHPDGMQIHIKIDNQNFTATLAENETAKAFKQKLPLTLNMSELNGNEKYNYLSENLPSNASHIGTIHSGDIMLYGTNCVVLFYEAFSSSYSYTRIGWIDDTTNLKKALGSGNVAITFSAEKSDDKSPVEEEKNPNDTEKPNESAQDFVFKKENNSYTITDYIGKEASITIPSEYDGLPVTKIQGDYGTGAFARKNITSVLIPDSIKEIGQNTFNNCSLLEAITIGENSHLSKIGNNAFSGNSSLKRIYIPASMIELGDSVFNNCGSLESIDVAENNTVYRSENGHLIEKATQTLIRGSNNGVIPDGIKSIAQAAFRKATSIEVLSIPKSVETIANYIIADSSITSISYAGTEAEWSMIVKSKMWNFKKDNIQLSFKSIPLIEEEKEITKMYLYINGNRLEVTLAQNVATNALIEILKQNDITFIAKDYGGFEKVGSLGHTLPTDDSQITTQSGDVILYSGDQIVLFYGSNLWSYTRLGKIHGYSISELSTLLNAGNGSIQVRISLK